MAKNKARKNETRNKKTSIGNSKFTKHGHPGPDGGNKNYRKKYRGQGSGK